MTFAWFTILYSFFISPEINHPKTIPELNAVYDVTTKCVVLKWKHTLSGKTSYVLQRSNDNLIWISIYSPGSEESSKIGLITYNDFRFHSEINYYRLQISHAGQIQFTEPLLIHIGTSIGNWTIFPVPVSNVINLQYKGSEPIRHVISVFIRNMHGYVLTRKRYSTLTRQMQIPVDNLGKGVYEIYIVIDGNMVWKQRFTK